MLCRNQYDLLNIMLNLIDDPGNDIYIHLDKKAAPFPYESLAEVVKYSTVTFCENPPNVQWGDDSIARAEMKLYQEAYGSKYKYSYYRFISGCALPVKNKDCIHRFFNNENRIFMGYKIIEKYLYEYMRLSHCHARMKYINFICNKIQSLFFIDRIRNIPLVGKGANWASLPYAAV